MNRSGAKSLHHGSAKVLVSFTSKVGWDIYSNRLGETEHKKKTALYTLCVLCSHHFCFNCVFYSAFSNVFSPLSKQYFSFIKITYSRLANVFIFL